MGILNTKKAFTMAEAILVMTILGIIATIMITTLKPAQFKDKGLEIMARKVLSEIDTAITQILISDTQGGSLLFILDPNNSGYTYVLADDAYINTTAKIFKKYLTATRQEVSGNSFCVSNGATAFYLKDGACIGLKTIVTGLYNTIFPGELSEVRISVGPDFHIDMMLYVDTNGDEGPNVLGKDRFALPVVDSGIMYAVD